MSTHTRLLLVAVLCLELLPTQAASQGTLWERNYTAGRKAYRQGRHAEAEKQLLAALQEAEKFVPEDPRLVRNLNSLATLYIKLGNYAEAVTFIRRSLVIQEKVPGPEHPNLATTLHNLATLYRFQGKYAEAEPLYLRSLAIREKALGLEHLNVAISLENYADLLRKTNRNDEAAEMEARAKAIRANHSRRIRRNELDRALLKPLFMDQSAQLNPYPPALPTTTVTIAVQ